ncbi:Hypothetical protein PBC10988_26060 [Planctomycetales bacterium 10988]|nr:Hypothetical protein PBC10988_26060 [Planctomycetales bacterium 10988]
MQVAQRLILPGLTHVPTQSSSFSPSSSARVDLPVHDFWSGPENQVLIHLWENLLKSPEAPEHPSPENPILLYGPSGVGKSHLVWGLAHLREQQLSQDKQINGSHSQFVCYETARQFADEYIQVYRASRTPGKSNASTDELLPQFRERYLRLKLWVLEDIEDLAGKAGTQQALVGLWESLLGQRIQLIFTSKKPPHSWIELSPALRSRLAGGLSLPIAPAGPEARCALVENILSNRGIPFDQEAVRNLALKQPGGVRELLGAIHKLSTIRRLEGGEIDAEGVKRLQSQAPPPLNPPTLSEIARQTARTFHRSVAELRSSSRRQAIVQARGVAIFLARELTNLSHEQIGQYFGGRDHTTILHADRATRRRVQQESALKQQVAELTERLKQRQKHQAVPE